MRNKQRLNRKNQGIFEDTNLSSHNMHIPARTRTNAI